MTNRAVLACALALSSVAWLFAGPLFAGRVLYYRDVGVTYYPDLVFAARALEKGVWPLWHPGADAGAPFLMAYPVHLLLLLAAGARTTLAVSPALHVLLAIGGASLLARRLGSSPAGAAVAGFAFGLSGLVLGSVLYPVFLAAAWAPLAVERFLALVQAPTARRSAGLALVLAVQVSTLGVEAVVQTAILGLVLLPRRPRRREVLAAAGSLLLAAALAAPVLLGVAAMMRGTARDRGFSPDVGMSYSAPLPVLLEAVLPRFLGDPHTFGDAGFWGQPFYPNGSPFFLSLYLGPVVLLLAARAGLRGNRRLWGLVALGVLVSLGAHGPLASVLAPAMSVMRVPAKFFLLSTLALAVLAGKGLDGATVVRRASALPALLPGLLVLGLSLAALAAPASLSVALAWLVPEAGGALARDVVARRWPVELAATGAVALGAGLVLARGGRLATLAGLLALLDLLRVNGELNPSADPGFYELRPGVARAVETVRAGDRGRVFSYGVANSPPLRWNPAVARRNSDVWLFYMDRQSLLPRTHVLDGLEGAFDVDRMGLAPEGSTLGVAEARPERFRQHHERLRLANVRWVLSFVPLPDDLVAPREELRFDEVQETLRLFELRRPLPRAFHVPSLDDLPSLLEQGPHGTPAPPVAYEELDPHTVRLTATTPPGFLVVLDGHDPGWRASDSSGAVSLHRVLGRYRAVATAGGRRVITLRYEPAWRGPGLLLAASGALAVLLMVAWGSEAVRVVRGSAREAHLGSRLGRER